jgi:hypothetical protein
VHKSCLNFEIKIENSKKIIHNCRILMIFEIPNDIIRSEKPPGTS